MNTAKRIGTDSTSRTNFFIFAERRADDLCVLTDMLKRKDEFPWMRRQHRFLIYSNYTKLLNERKNTTVIAILIQ